MATKFELFYPVKPWVVTQGFGGNVELYGQFGIDGHNGLDIAATHGQPVFAAHDGIVTYAGMDSNEGVGVVLRTEEQFDYGEGVAYMKSIYWHLINNIVVRVGQKVKAGDLLGYADNTGFSSGDHLHFAVKPIAQGENEWIWYNVRQKNGYNGAVDPTPFFNGYYAQDAQQVISALEQQIKLLMMQIVILLKNKLSKLLGK